MVKKIRLDRSVRLVRPETRPQAGSVIPLKSPILKTDEESTGIEQNQRTKPLKPVDWFDYFFKKKKLVKILSFLLKKGGKIAQLEQKLISVRTLILLVCLFTIYS